MFPPENQPLNARIVFTVVISLTFCLFQPFTVLAGEPISEEHASVSKLVSRYLLEIENLK